MNRRGRTLNLRANARGSNYIEIGGLEVFVNSHLVFSLHLNFFSLFSVTFISIISPSRLFHFVHGIQHGGLGIVLKLNWVRAVSEYK